MSGLSEMDHGAAHERIQDLLLEPARLATLQSSSNPDDLALREHVAGCPACATDLETWRRLGVAIAGALPQDADAALEAVEPMEQPPSLRARVIGAVHDAAQEGAAHDGGVSAPVSLEAAPAGGAAPAGTPMRRGQRLAPWLGLAASLVALLGVSWMTLDQANRRDAAESAVSVLTNVVAAVDRVLAADHEIVAMRTPDGRSAGSISWSRHDWVVLTTALTEPPANQRYKCWLEESGRTVQVGEMSFAGGTAYWVGSLDEWATWEIGPQTEFLVTLEAVDATDRTGTPVLSADLGS